MDSAYRELIETATDDPDIIASGEWDPVSSVAVANAAYLLYQLPQDSVPDNVSPLPNGGVYIDWDRRDVRYEVFIYIHGPHRLLRIDKTDPAMPNSAWTSKDIWKMEEVAKVIGTLPQRRETEHEPAKGLAS